MSDQTVTIRSVNGLSAPSKHKRGSNFPTVYNRLYTYIHQQLTHFTKDILKSTH